MWRYRPSTLPVLFLILLSITGSSVRAQGFEDIKLATSPTAGILPHGSYIFQGSLGPDNSLLFGTQVGFHGRLMLGASFGIQRFIGRGDIEINDRPGFSVRFRLIEEGFAGPAVAVGLDTQGEDAFLEEDERYERKSKGLFAVFSKNYLLLKNFTLHGGVNYTFEKRDEAGLNIFGGFALEVVTGMSLLLDYNAAIDDDDSEQVTSRTRGRGYLDAGVSNGLKFGAGSR